MLREKQFRQLCIDRGLGSAEVDNAVATVCDFIDFADFGEGSLEQLGADTTQEYVQTLIARGENTLERLAALLRYAYVADLKEVYTYLAGITGAHGVIQSIAARTGELAGPAARARVFDGMPLPPLGSPQAEYPAVVDRLVAGLQVELGPDCTRRVLAGNHHRIPESNFEPLRARYLEDGLDAVLEYRREKLLNELREHARSGKSWYEQHITPAVVQYVEDHPEIGAGVRIDNTIVVSKIPYDPVAYLETDDPQLQRYYQCHCPLARASLLEGASQVSPEFCYCSAGFVKLPFEVALGEPLEVEVLETVLGGDNSCRFAITIPEGTVL